MQLFVDTSVWSLAFRRDGEIDLPQVRRLSDALSSGEPVFTTGLVLQELLQGFDGPKSAELIATRFESLPLVAPRRSDHVLAASLRNQCRRRGIQIGTIDALLAQLCIAHDLVMLSADRDFERIADHSDLRIWH